MRRKASMGESADTTPLGRFSIESTVAVVDKYILRMTVTGVLVTVTVNRIYGRKTAPNEGK
jgi:hypothetical protein